MRHLILSQWKLGFHKIGLNELLRERAGFTLAGAKSAVDILLEGKAVAIDLDDDIVDEFIDDVRRVGVEAHVADHVA